MRKTIIILYGLLFIATLTIAQGKKAVFGYGLSTDFLSIPLSEQSLATQSTNAFITLTINDNLSFMTGYDGILLKNLDTKSFDTNTGFLLGAGYTVFRDQSGNFTTELSASVTNSFAKFFSFKDYHADFGLRFLMFKSFFLGSGVRLNHNETSAIISSPLNSFNFYMDLGIQLYMGKK